MPDISSAEINSIFSVFRDAVNKSIYLNIGVDGAALTITDFKLEYARIDFGNADNNTVSAEVALSAGTFTGAHVDNQGSFAGPTANASDALMRVDVPDAAFAVNADTVIITIRNDVAIPAIRKQVAIKILHPAVLADVIDERDGVVSAVITKAGTPGVQQYIVIYSKFIGTAFQFGRELLSSLLAATPEESTPDERDLLPILGFYYQDGANNISQISGICLSMGVDVSTDLLAAGWTNAGDEDTGGTAGYTFVCPVVSGYNIPESSEKLFLFYGTGEYATGELSAEDVRQIRHRLNLDGDQEIPTAGGAAKMAGTDADLTLKSIIVSNSAGSAVQYISTGSNGDGLRVLGNGSGSGLRANAGLTGSGIIAFGSDVGAGIHAIGDSTTGVGIKATGWTAGIQAAGDPSGNNTIGLLIQSGGSNAGSAMKVESLATDGIGIEVIGKGTEPGIKSTGGATGNGLYVLGGATGGSAIKAEAQAGNNHGIHSIGKATGTGMFLAGGDAGGDGFRATGDSGGKGMNITGGNDGIGILVSAGGGDNAAILAVAQGTGSGIHAKGAAATGTGHGILAQSGEGATGDGIRAESLATNGNGLNTIKTGTGIDLKATDHGDGSWESASANPNVLQTTTIANLVSQTVFDLVAGSADDDAYNGSLAIVTDVSTGTQKCVGIVLDYAGATKTITLFRDPGVFTMANTDLISIIAAKELTKGQTNEGIITAKVNAIPLTANALVLKSLSNDAAADLNISDLINNRNITFISGVAKGQTVGITSQAPSAAPVTFATTNMANFANIAVDDEVIIT